ncbi:hypothetical protein NLX86_30075 [Streptomyces sp. A3M-1-3]|uniref:hypothetical protein n=1 Tax=Streptomyces sp. A3M-1-3 TaxID=2962044 RepID=UPI0020B810B3|nr:hypothetical protein [Streptomyces sp. A3M-1-3]MCP3822185.1 hypothetical protein [Streptomyces sp. A3M-1-3]
MEGHANWDAKANVDYDNKLAANVEVAVSSGSNWKIQGSVNLGSSTGHSTGYTNRGPYFAKQWRVPIEYKMVRVTWICGPGVAVHYEIIAGKYDASNGRATGLYGKDVRHKDGYSAYIKSPVKNRAYVTAGSYFQISKGRSVKWSAAVTAYGISLGASTQYDREHKQRITAGTQNARHDIWGHKGPVSEKPGVFYSY